MNDKKNILGLDLGTNSIGWALVEESENKQSKIIDCGVRIPSLSADEINNFDKGKSFSLAQERTQKRGARRNLDRYQQRRKKLKNTLTEHKIIDEKFVLAENGKHTTHHLLKLRAKSATEKIDLKDFARVLFALNKKRGYKSGRKDTPDEKEGQTIDGMEIAIEISNRKITPGQYVLEQLEKVKQENKKRDKKQQRKYKVPAFYRSDLQEEFDKIWNCQKQFHSELNDALKEKLAGKNKKDTEKEFKGIFAAEFKKEWQEKWDANKPQNPEFFTDLQFEKLEKPEAIIKFFSEQNIQVKPVYIAEPKNEKGKKANTEEKKYQFYKWRTDALTQKLALNEVATILVEINNQINQSSGYLGAISDRSKELHFNKQTVGQYLYAQIQQNPHNILKDQVFYRSDYEKEFETVWEKQKEFYPNALTDDLKKNIKDITIFYQRPLKSCKHLIGECEFEKRKSKEKEYGVKVCPKSSPLFQEFRIWQNINNLKIKKGREQLELNQEAKNEIFKEANLKGELTSKALFKVLGYTEEEYSVNFKKIEGNRTNAKIYKAFQMILEEEGYDLEVEKMSADKILDAVTSIFKSLNIDTKILHFNSDLKGNDLDKQPAMQFWHILYATREETKAGEDATIKKLKTFGFTEKHAKILSNLRFEDDYANLSSKALKNILPFMKNKGLTYDKACEKAGYNHSNYLTKEENNERELSKKMDALKKNSLRNPVVEKVLNQMINTVNAVIEKYGKPDEVRVELARDLKKSAKERKEISTYINKATKEHQEIKTACEKYTSRVTKKDIIKYKLWEESNHQCIYTGKNIEVNQLFNGDYDVEHIIPKALLFDDSFSNKTLCESKLNREKGKMTAYDFMRDEYGENSKEFVDYLQRVENLFKDKKGKKKKLLMTKNDIPEDFIERDLRETQYISKKATQLLKAVFRNVHTTSGMITDRLRDDWQLTQVMQEINWEKYKILEMTYYEKSKPDEQGNTRMLPKIKDWTKRDDHRHHAVDAIITAFTKQEHVQYLNSLNELNFDKEKLKDFEADKTNSKHYKKLKMLKTFEKKYLYRKENKNGDKKGALKFKAPFDDFKKEVKQHLNGLLISQRANQKVVTKNTNKIKTKNGVKKQDTFTPRGFLHEDTVQGCIKRYKTKEEKIGVKFDEVKIKTVAKKSQREALLKRLKEFDGNSKKAFGGKNSPAKNPVLDSKNKPLPEKVKLIEFKEQYTKRKPITPDLKIEQVIDKGIKEILEKRLKEFGGNKTKAFANLEETPIWLNKEKGISIKRVTITGSKSLVPIGVKRDHLGNIIKDKNGKEIFAHFVQTGNNHHIAVYEDEQGKWQEEVVSFWDAVERKGQGESIVKTTHEKGWQFLFSMAINDYFILGGDDFEPTEIDLTDPKHKTEISKHLFRVQKISEKNYEFRHHLETTVTREKVKNKEGKTTNAKNKKLENTVYSLITSLPNTKNKETHPFSKIAKVRLDRLGNIVEVIYPKNA